jgi:hypothetical protein
MLLDAETVRGNFTVPFLMCGAVRASRLESNTNAEESDQMGLYKLAIPPEILKRGFWLYVWIIKLRGGRAVHYVGRTGDSSSPNAQSPISRISGHLGPNAHANALRRHLNHCGIEFTNCEALEFVTYGPLEDEVKNWDDHKPRRDRTHALERDLCNGLIAAGYEVMNVVTCTSPTDEAAWTAVRAAFRDRFERLSV